MKDFSYLKDQVLAEQKKKQAEEKAYLDSILASYNQIKHKTAMKITNAVKSWIDICVQSFYKGNKHDFKKVSLFGRKYEISTRLSSYRFETHDRDFYKNPRISKHIAQYDIYNRNGKTDATVIVCPTYSYAKDIIQEVNANLRREGYDISISLNTDVFSLPDYKSGEYDIHIILINGKLKL